VDEEVTAVVCPTCCAHMGPLPVAYSPPDPNTGARRPKGWRFMKVFVDSEGNVYNRGEEQPALKGTLEPTKIESKPKKSRFQKEQEKQVKEKKLAERYAKKQEKIKAAEAEAAAKKAEAETSEDGND